MLTALTALAIGSNPFGRKALTRRRPIIRQSLEPARTPPVSPDENCSSTSRSRWIGFSKDPYTKLKYEKTNEQKQKNDRRTETGKSNCHNG